MSKKSQTPSSDVRAVLLDPSPYAGPTQPTSPLKLTQRKCGGELVGWHVRDDLIAALAPLIALPLSARCHRLVDRALGAEASWSALGRLLPRLEARLFEEADRRDLPEGASTKLCDAALVLPYHSAELGCPIAAARISADALSLATLFVSGGDHAQAFLCLRHALLRADDAQVDITDAAYKPAPLYPRLIAYDLKAASWLEAWNAIAAGLRMVEDEDAILRGGAGQAPQDGGLAWDFPLPEEQPSAEDLRAIADASRILMEGARRRAALTLVVFPSLAHLAEPTKSNRDRGDSPRASAEAWAERGMPLTPAPDPRTVAESLRARFPWAREAIEAYANDLVGAPFARLSPRILVGPAGYGKTAFARAVLEAAGLDVTLYSVAGQIDGGSFAGTSRQWGTWRQSVPAQGCLRFGKASHGVVVDEVEKGGDSRRWGRIDETILPFLERGSTARAIHDPALECALDLSAVSYVLTANSLDGVSGPLRDRCQVLEWPAPRAEDLPVVAAGILADLRRERGLDETWCPGLDGSELDALSVWRGGSLRPLRRMIEAVLASRETYALKH